MTKQHLHVGVESAERGFDRFIDAWERAERGSTETEIHLNFEQLEQLLAILTPKRLELLRGIRRWGPISVRALAKQLTRDYKNVHTDIRALEAVELIERDAEGNLVTPWDVIDAHLQLCA